MPKKNNEIVNADDNNRPQRYIARVKAERPSAAVKALSDSMGLSVASAADFDDGAVNADSLGEGSTIYLDKLGIAIIQAPEEQVATFEVGKDSAISSLRPEREFFIMGSDFQRSGRLDLNPSNAGAELGLAGGNISVSTDYLRGYQAGINRLIAELSNGIAAGNQSAVLAQLNQDKATWGLQVTSVLSSPFTGKGVRVAVLDTGIDLKHPDFLGRKIKSKSFVPGASTAQDGNGHGTHCAGTICGPVKPALLPRYGVAPEVDLFVGKVLSDSGSGFESSILMGINWALTNNCRIISMSLGRPVGVGEPPDEDYEEIGQIALDNNCLIIAAAGNESDRPGMISPVGAPANSTTIMAVAALEDLNNGIFGPGFFSNGGINPGGGKVDIAAPGVAVHSCWSTSAPKPQPGTRYRSISGTSMATPHVAGIAALWIQKNKDASADKIMQQLTQTAKALSLPARDVGSGLAQAPQAS